MRFGEVTTKADRPESISVKYGFPHKDRLMYSGLTTNIEERVKNHDDGKTKSTAPRRPLQLIFCEFYLFEDDARKREMYFKTTAGKKAIKLMLAGTLLKLGYKVAAGNKADRLEEFP